MMNLPPPPPPHRHEKRLSADDRRILEAARRGVRDPETMSGWTFRIGLQGLSGRRAVQVRPWNHDTWFWVEWCPSAVKQVPQVPVERLEASGFDRAGGAP